MSTATRSPRRDSARVTGVVQGVGFRPYVYRLARDLELSGFVLNDEQGVLIEVEGKPRAVAAFFARLPQEAPPAVRIERITSERIEPRGDRGFAIAGSQAGAEPRPQIGPDIATCDRCLAELLDPDDRRYRYPFTNCTDCGPRFTIVTGIPYDRPQTTMAGFEMCTACRAEYDDPGDRRFHAQPNACPDCGPTLRLLDREGVEVEPGSGDAVAVTARALADGAIVAVKGIGGYHLACRADDEAAVAALRARKRREEKPFALMAPDLEAAAELVELGAPERAILAGPERPILIARRRPGAPVAAAVAPANPDLGVMLPYSPLHHLLLVDAGANLVMTSANHSDEPIAHTDRDALSRLGSIADLFCVHDRPIETRTDDSVVRALALEVRPEPLVLRRSRGWVPTSTPLPVATAEPILACGAELKNTFCLARGSEAWVSHHIGDLKNFETLGSFRSGINRLEQLLELEPRIVAHDLHPDYLSTRYAEERAGVERLAVQHHHAHLAAVLAEHGLEGPAVGVIYDGAGHGPDGTVWGGELLVGGLSEYERGGLLLPVRLPGGDKAAAEPWRMACAWAQAAFGEGSGPAAGPLAERVEPEAWEAVAGICRTGLASPLTTSAGRLFDAVAAILGLRAETSYEGQAAIELEALAATASGAPAATVSGAPNPYPMPVLDERPGPLVIDPRETIRAIDADLEAGAAPADIAARFHAALGAATVEAAALLAGRHGIESVVLGGGVFANRLLLEAAIAGLRERGLHPVLPQALPPGDGAISYGQAAVAAARLSAAEGESG